MLTSPYSCCPRACWFPYRLICILPRDGPDPTRPIVWKLQCPTPLSPYSTTRLVSEWLSCHCAPSEYCSNIDLKLGPSTHVGCLYVGKQLGISMKVQFGKLNFGASNVTNHIKTDVRSRSYLYFFQWLEFFS